MSRISRVHIWIHLGILALYAVLAVVLTWPLGRYLGTHVPGSYTWAFDEYTFLWNTWWFRYTLFDLGQNPLTSTHTFYPLGISLAFYTYNLFNAIISLPLQPFLSLPAISNLIFLFATVFSWLWYIPPGQSPPRNTRPTAQHATRVASTRIMVLACLPGWPHLRFWLLPHDLCRHRPLRSVEHDLDSVLRSVPDQDDRRDPPAQRCPGGLLPVLCPAVRSAASASFWDCSRCSWSPLPCWAGIGGLWPGARPAFSNGWGYWLW